MLTLAIAELKQLEEASANMRAHLETGAPLPYGATVKEYFEFMRKHVNAAQRYEDML